MVAEADITPDRREPTAPSAAPKEDTDIARSSHSFERYKRERRKQLKRQEKLERRQERIAAKRRAKNSPEGVEGEPPAEGSNEDEVTEDGAGKEAVVDTEKADDS